MENVWEWFRWLYTHYGINLSFLSEPFERKRFFAGFLTTVYLSALCIFFSLVIGVVGAWLQGGRMRITRKIVNGYIQFFRNTPPLIQLYFFYFALGNLLPQITRTGGGGVSHVSSFTWAVITLSCGAGAFNMEIFRAGIEAVPASMIEAAEALGYSRVKAYIHVVLPLAFRISLPALNNNLVNTVKTTTLAYAIGVSELLYVSAQIWADEMNVSEMMILLLFTYVGIIGVLIAIMYGLERTLRIPGYTS